ncbi:hypothetical protein J4214_04935 [Candidatus Woesearchaeota archaeon]|nr:hypothetical protein [Candidatus Woesearchaeota archaeon]
MADEGKVQKILIRAVIEIAGFPKEHIEATMKKLMENIKENFNLDKYDIFEANQIDKVWSTFSEVEIYFDGVDKVIGFCIDYLPSSVEILEPKNVNIENFKFADVINDLIGKLHQYETVIRSLRASNIRMKKKIEDEGKTGETETQDDTSESD